MAMVTITESEVVDLCEAISTITHVARRLVREETKESDKAAEVLWDARKKLIVMLQNSKTYKDEEEEP